MTHYTSTFQIKVLVWCILVVFHFSVIKHPGNLGGKGLALATVVPGYILVREV